MGRKRRNNNATQMVFEEESYSSTKYEKRTTKKTSRYGKNDDNRSLNLKTRLSAQTEAQGQMIASIVSNTITVAKGPAGTGKTCVATLKAAQMLNDKEVDKVILTRPVVEIGKSMGFLPGSIDEKYEPYLVPFKEHLIMAFGKSGYEARLNKSIFPVAINFVQGQTWDNAVILIDEVQNMTAQEMYMVLTRIGRNSKAILTGDIKQTANGNLKHDNGLADLEKRYRNNTSIFEKGDFGFVEFTSDDIVRSDIVRRIIEMYET